MRRPFPFLKDAGLLLLALLFFFSAVVDTDAKTKRDAKARRDFIKQNPCPSTGQIKGSCPGYIVDHRIGLCVGGEDAPSNMRWMTTEAASKKDRWECKPGWETHLEECEANDCFFTKDKWE